VAKHAVRIKKNGHVLDLACGSGRHALYLAARDLHVVAADRDVELLRRQTLSAEITLKQADFENAAWPFEENSFDAIVVTNYLHRPLFARIIDTLKVGGILIYETFAIGNEKFGKPSNPDFLLRPGELLDVARGHMRVIAYEDDYVEIPKPAMIQRIYASKL
jgi:SAM-dependent methyltransferase